MIRKWLRKGLITAILGIGGFFCFITPEKIIIQKEVQVTETIKNTTTIEDDGLKNFCEYIGLFLIVYAAWQWRKEIGVDSFVFFSKQLEVKPTDPNNRDNDEGDTPPDKTPPIIQEFDSKSDNVSFKEFQINEKLKMILELMRENPNSITNPSIIANKIGVSKNKAESYLFELMEKKLVRKDTYPGSKSSVYSLTNSLDNLAIDHFIVNYLKSEEIFGDYRFVRLKSRYEIDALIKTSKTNYIIETKFLKKFSIDILNRGIQQLLKLEEEINLAPVFLVLLIVGSVESMKEIQTEKLNIKENLKIYLIDKEKITTSNKH